MNAIATSGDRRHKSRLLCLLIALCLLACSRAAIAQSGIILSLVKSDNAPSPVPSGQVFTYTITYSYSSAFSFTTGSPGTLIISDAVPPGLDVTSVDGGVGGSVVVVGNYVEITTTGLTHDAGGGTVQINARFKPGVTCPGTQACNVAYIHALGDVDSVGSNSDCVTAFAENKWILWKRYIAGCLIEDGDIIYEIDLINPNDNDIGGLNLSSVSLTDFLPPGAIITSIVPFDATPGADWSGPYPSSGTVTFTGGPTSFIVEHAWRWFGCTIHVRYPSASFSAGEVVTNRVQLRYQTPCTAGGYETKDASADNTLCGPVPGGDIIKYLLLRTSFTPNPWYLPTWAPGCCGTYSFAYTNSGGLSQPDLVLDDTIPAIFDISSILSWVPPGVTSVDLDLFCCVPGGGCSTTPWMTHNFTTTTDWPLPAVPPGPICHIRWRYHGVVAPAVSFAEYVNVCMRSFNCATGLPVLPGDNVINLVCASGTNVPPALCTSRNDPVMATAPNVLAAKFFEGKSGSCTMPSCTPATAGPFFPGDIVRFRIAVANVGNLTAATCHITDVLPPGFTYHGGETYWYGSLSGSSPSDINPSCCAMLPTPPIDIMGLTPPSLLPVTGSPSWSFGALPATCGGDVSWLIIDFDAQVDPLTPPNNYFNTYTFSADNLTLPVTSGVAEVTINATARVECQKDVRPYLSGLGFAPTANVPQGGQAEYRLRVLNTGTLALADLKLLDIMPHFGDIAVLPPYTPRVSAFDIPITIPVLAVPGYTALYNNVPTPNTKNPIRSAIFCPVTPDPTILTPPLTLGNFVPWWGTAPATYSFLIQAGTPATMIPPGGTQDFFFVGTVPMTAVPGQTACNSFGLQVRPNGTTDCIKTESRQACVKATMTTHSPCDSIWGPVLADSCCNLTTSILHTLGNVVRLDYTVLPGGSPGGVVQTVATSPCLPSMTIPASLSGTTSGSLIFLPAVACPGTMTVQIHATSTTPSGIVCIALKATILGPNNKVTICTDTLCIHCNPAPKERCDSLAVQPYVGPTLSGRMFTIYNMKAPVSPICSVKIAATPPPIGGLTGSGLLINTVPHAWVSGLPSGYTVITTADGLPATSTVQFILAVGYSSWFGTVTVTVYHCDGDSCTMTYTWDPRKKDTVIDIGTTTTVPNISSLYMNALSFSRGKAKGLHVRSIAVKYSDPVSEIVAVTGAAYPCDANAQANCNDIFGNVHVADRSLMIDLRRDLDDQLNVDDPLLTVVYRTTDNTKSPTAEIIYYDNHGQEVGHDDVVITGENPPPSKAISGLGGMNKMEMIMGALTANPNPTTGRCDIGFTLQNAGKVDLELVDARGTTVATVVSDELYEAGEHHRMVDIGAMPSGTYLVTLRVNGVPSVLRLELTR